MKRCPTCGEVRQEADFYTITRPGGRKALRYRCKACDILKSSRKNRPTPPRPAGPKVCGVCGVELSGENTYARGRLGSRCQGCERRVKRAAKYSLTIGRLDEMYRRQDGRCGVCADSLSDGYVVDHDHSCCSGTRACGQCVRGLLCIQCNFDVTVVERRSPEWFASATEYLNG